MLRPDPAWAGETVAPPSATNQVLTLNQCLATAMEKSHFRPASQFAVAAAEAQHRQALAGYWPQLNLKGSYHHLNDSPDFLFPAERFSTPGGTMQVTVPAGVLGPTAVQLPVSFPNQTVAVPAQDVKLMDPDVLCGSAEATWLVYDGGMRRGYREQAQAGLDAARQEARRTDLQVADSVRRMYYGAVLARQLHQLGKDTLARLDTTLNLTETMYKEGSGKVTKADFLENKVTVESLRAMVAELEKNEAMSQAALANTMGLSWKESIEPADPEIPFEPYAAKLDEMVGAAYQFNPDWEKLEAGIRATDGAVRTARSGHYPKVALTGNLHAWWNQYDAGMATSQNKTGWDVGVGMEVPLFDGFLTRNKVKEALARSGEVREQQFLLREGIGLQVKDIFLSLEAARKSFQSTAEAMKAAQENRDLNIRAYQSELVETEKVIRAQLVEALMTAVHYKTRYDHVALQSQLNLVVGTEIWKRLATP
jgi:outer membrane protein TolC